MSLLIFILKLKGVFKCWQRHGKLALWFTAGRNLNLHNTIPVHKAGKSSQFLDVDPSLAFDSQ